MSEKFSLKWNDFQSKVSKSFSDLRKENDFLDVTLVSDDGKCLPAHKLVLSASSSFFKSILRKASHSNPMIYLSGFHSKNLHSMMDYIYEGEVQILQDDIDEFLDVAQKLKIENLIGSHLSEENDVSSDVFVKDPLPEEEIFLKNDDTDCVEDFSSENLEPEHEVTDDLIHPISQFSSIVDAKAAVDELVEKMAEERRKMKTQIRRSNMQTTPISQFSSVVDAKAAVDELVEKIDDCWTCKECGKTTTNKRTLSDLRRHAEIHIKGLAFDCQLCGKTFGSRIRLNGHKMREHKKKIDGH